MIAADCGIGHENGGNFLLVKRISFAIDSVIDAVNFACRSLCRLDAVLLSNRAAELCHKALLGKSESLPESGMRCSSRNKVSKGRAKWGLSRIRGPDRARGERFEVGLVCYRARDHGGPVPALLVSG